MEADHNDVVAFSRADRRLILTTGGLVVLAAGLWVVILVFFTGANDRAAPEDGPLYLGQRHDLEVTLDEGSPLYFANPFGGRGFWLDREGGELVALDVGLPHDRACSVRWKGRVDSYVDCDGNHVTKADLARFELVVSQSGKRKGGVLVDLQTHLPAPATP